MQILSHMGVKYHFFWWIENQYWPHLILLIIRGYQGASRSPSILTFNCCSLIDFPPGYWKIEFFLISTFHKPSLGSCEVPKNNLGPVGSAVFPLIGDKQTEKYIYIYRLFLWILVLLLLWWYCTPQCSIKFA